MEIRPGIPSSIRLNLILMLPLMLLSGLILSSYHHHHEKTSELQFCYHSETATANLYIEIAKSGQAPLQVRNIIAIVACGNTTQRYPCLNNDSGNLYLPRYTLNINVPKQIRSGSKTAVTTSIRGPPLS